MLQSWTKFAIFGNSLVIEKRHLRTFGVDNHEHVSFHMTEVAFWATLMSLLFSGVTHVLWSTNGGPHHSWCFTGTHLCPTSVARAKGWRGWGSPGWRRWTVLQPCRMSSADSELRSPRLLQAILVGNLVRRATTVYARSWTWNCNIGASHSICLLILKISKAVQYCLLVTNCLVAKSAALISPKAHCY